LNTQYINPLETEGQKQREENNYRKDYPLYGTTRLRKSTLARIKQYGKYGMSVDEIVVNLLDRLEEGRQIGDDNQSW
jgi:hypothetical protein